MTNEELAARLTEVADLLEAQPQANPFRVAAYRRAVRLLRRIGTPVEQIYRREGTEGLDSLPWIGPGLAGSIRELIQTGRLSLLDRLREEAGNGLLFSTLPGIGPERARRLREELGATTLPELEQAIRDGRLRRLRGFGPKLERQLREALETRLRRVRPTEEAAPVDELLDVDREYREKASAGELRTIAPRRFNPDGKAWLPVLHTRRGPREYTALFSNTQLAHELGRTNDWVVLYYGEPGGPQHQATVVTETRGPLRGKRVVRGREGVGARSSQAGPPPAVLARAG
jgi:hypothetical protein